MKNFNKANITENVIKDYMFMCFFLGNDFMPHFPSVNIRKGGIDKVLDIYEELGVNLIEDNINFTYKLQKPQKGLAWI